jgi:hypothetical protein
MHNNSVISRGSSYGVSMCICVSFAFLSAICETACPVCLCVYCAVFKAYMGWKREAGSCGVGGEGGGGIAPVLLRIVT